MKPNEPASVPKPGAITFARWKSAPLACSQLWIGRRLVNGSDRLVDLGLRLMTDAEAKLAKMGEGTDA